MPASRSDGDPRTISTKRAGFAGALHPVADLHLLSDLTWHDASGARRSEQSIFAAELAMIGAARRLVLADQFLYNPWRGAASGDFLPLCQAFTEALVAQRRRHPELRAILITDPVNTAYGAVWPRHFEQLREAGVEIVLTPLKRLPDSNPVWSTLWRGVLRHLALDGLGRLPHPFDAGEVRLGTYLRLLHFKANHRKTLIADVEGRWTGLISSSNPHDASCWHHNLALRFGGPAVADLVATENAVLAVAGHEPVVLPAPLPPESIPDADAALRVAVLTETAIRDRVLAELGALGPSDTAGLVMFYLSHRTVIRALIAAHRRGAAVRVLLDANHDAFGRVKDGVPNRQVAWELNRAGISVRWIHTHGEQAHGKWLLLRRSDGSGTLLSGSANFTRRNLDGFNLETDLLVNGSADHAVFAAAGGLFERLWTNAGGVAFSLPYGAFAEPWPLKYLRYRFMEASGWSTF